MGIWTCYYGNIDIFYLLPTPRRLGIPLPSLFLCLKGDYMKKWVDANEVIKMVHELPNDRLREIDKEMVSIPRFDKNKKDNPKR
ncbi:hypothetical protein CHF27_011145 [Romboutsia maritimum]|uniref:Uncharacterized protein n=1 Tax=Romboutsia maritimum TaxID=2020948 RepID=A0A371IQV6_9FIRM|nr:hypothetical protein CHF27_011145 [Romboutsia maritimum]